MVCSIFNLLSHNEKQCFLEMKYHGYEGKHRAQNNLLIRKFIIYQVKANEKHIIVNGGRPLRCACASHNNCMQYACIYIKLLVES